MAGFIQNIIWNSVEGFVEAGTRSVGEYAGDALIKAGDYIENSGRGVGAKIERSASNYGQKIAGQGYHPSPSPGKALPSTALKPVIKRSNSLPANTKSLTKGSVKGAPTGGRTIAGSTSKTPIGANKYSGGKAPMKQITGNAGPKLLTNGPASDTVVKSSKKNGRKALNEAANNKTNLPKANVQPLPTTTTSASTAPKGKKAPTPANTSTSKPTTLPKPFANPSAVTPTLNTAKKTPVKPGKPKPFIVENTTIPQKKTPVRPGKPKPFGAAAENKGPMNHIPGFGGGSEKGAFKGSGGSGGKKEYGGPVKTAGGGIQHIPGFGSGGSVKGPGSVVGAATGGAGKDKGYKGYGGPVKPAGGPVQHIPGFA